MVHAEVELKWRLPFSGNHCAVSYIREKYALKDSESSVRLFESEFNCKFTWDRGRYYLQFNSERDYLWFVLKWS